MFTGINEEMCLTAWDMILPTIEDAAKCRITTRLAGCMVVLDPRIAYDAVDFDILNMPVLFEATTNGPNQDGKEKYVRIARAKAFLTWKHRLPSSVIQQQYPYLFADGDTKWGGSTIDAGGLIVAFSGVQAVYDEMFAEMMASAIRALCRWEMTKPDGVMSQDYSFIGGDSV